MTSPPSKSTPFRQRDASMLLWMGVFFTVFAILVLIGLFWEQTRVERIVNVSAGGLLLACGVGTGWISHRLGQPRK